MQLWMHQPPSVKPKAIMAEMGMPEHDAKHVTAFVYAMN
jgi:hypothetical protein